jgi:hypothetical protein
MFACTDASVVADGSPDGQSADAMAAGVPDTEHLRLMLQSYRALFNQLCRPSSSG